MADPSSFDLNAIGALASIAALVPNFAQWFTSEYRAKRGKKKEQAKDVIERYIEWLRRQRHKELLEQLEGSREAQADLKQLVEQLAAQSDKRQDEILRYIVESHALDREQWDRMEGKLDHAISLFRSPADLSGDDKKFEKEYLGHVKQQFQRLRVLGVSEMRQIRQELSIAYVSLNLKSAIDTGDRKAAEGEDEEIEETESRRAEEVLRENPLLTIRGPAGSGKTTLLRWLALQCASTDLSEEENPWRNGIPFYIPLRRLEAKDQGRPKLQRFVSYTIDPDVWSKEPPKGWIDGVLERGRALILIDGVDELPPQVRPKFWAWLEKFIEHQKGNRVYVTSRPFPEPDDSKDEPLWGPPPEFVPAELDEMTEQDIKTFIDNWHNAVILQEEDKEERVELKRARDRLPQRLAEPRNRSVRELCRTPLLCSLVCAMHWREEGYLPASRIDLYENCCTMLIELRDVKKELPPIEGPLGALTLKDKEMILRRLALKMMRNKTGAGPRQQIEINRDQAISWVKLSIPSCASNEARKCIPSELIDHLIGRSGLLREPAKGLVDFPHRTFQEYLAACAAGEENEAGDLASRAGEDQWRETILLAAGTKTGGAPFGNALVAESVERGEREKKNKTLRHACFALALGCLETGGPNIKTELREQVLKHLQEITPPQNFEEARILAAAGEVVLPYLEYGKLTEANRRVNTVAASARTIALIGTREATRMLEGDRGYGSDARVMVLAEIVKCPSIDLRQIRGVCKYLGRGEGFPRALLPHLDEILRAFPERVTDINLFGRAKLSELSLPDLPNLQSLNLSACRALTQLALADLPTLQTLSLTWCHGLTQLTLPPLPNLQSLDLSWCTGLTQLALPDLPNLQSLNLSACESLTQLALPDLPNLQSLDLSFCETLTQLALPDLPKLRELDVRGCAGLKGRVPELPHVKIRR